LPGAARSSEELILGNGPKPVMELQPAKSNEKLIQNLWSSSIREGKPNTSTPSFQFYTPEL
jgi:hypothetical protein